MRICFWFIGAVFYFSTVEALPSVVPDPIPCFLALETGFFVESIVNQGLSLYDIRQELWVPINALLKIKSGEVPERMKVRTAFMVPNPIEYPMKKGVTAKILKEVLLQVFKEVILQYSSNEASRSDLIFEYIFSRQFPEFVKCFGPEVRNLKPKGFI